MWYHRNVTRRNYGSFNWDLLLDGEKHLVDLEAISWEGGVADFRATVHYQADKRRGQARTRKLGPLFLEVQAHGCTPLAQLQAAAAQRYKEQARRQANTWGPDPAPTVDRFAHDLLLNPADPAPQDQPPTPTVQALEPDDEALLGPCTCGQSPQCLPDCSRVTGFAA